MQVITGREDPLVRINLDSRAGATRLPDAFLLVANVKIYQDMPSLP